MSLDVHLTMKGAKVSRSSTIYIREQGQMREISREEWAHRLPGREPVTVEESESAAKLLKDFQEYETKAVVFSEKLPDGNDRWLKLYRTWDQSVCPGRRRRGCGVSLKGKQHDGTTKSSSSRN